MAIDVKLPELGDGITSGDVLEVLVAEGAVVKKDQGLLEIETDKATVTVPSPSAGKVVKILVAAGQSSTNRRCDSSVGRRWGGSSESGGTKAGSCTRAKAGSAKG